MQKIAIIWYALGWLAAWLFGCLTSLSSQIGYIMSWTFHIMSSRARHRHIITQTKNTQSSTCSLWRLHFDWLEASSVESF